MWLGGRGGVAYPAASAASLLLLLLFNELHGRSRGRGCSHGPDHLDAVLRQRGQAQALPAPHLHLLELLETPQGELEDKGWRQKQAVGKRMRNSRHGRSTCK